MDELFVGEMLMAYYVTGWPDTVRTIVIHNLGPA